jgi:hypothetical protein
MNIYKSIYILILGLIIGGCSTKNHLEIGSGNYVEGGYRPKLKCDSKRIEFEDHSGY